MELVVRIVDKNKEAGTPLASKTIRFEGGVGGVGGDEGWTMINFTLTPDSGTVCVDGVCRAC